jgi:hypothetical protein
VTTSDVYHVDCFVVWIVCCRFLLFLECHWGLGNEDALMEVTVRIVGEFVDLNVQCEGYEGRQELEALCASN